MNIGDASENSGLPPKTIRYYEDIELLKPARAATAIATIRDEDIHRLRFLQRSRSLGFSVEECRQLLSLYGDKARESADVKAIAEAKLAEIDRKIAELRACRRRCSTSSIIATATGGRIARSSRSCPVETSSSEPVRLGDLAVSGDGTDQGRLVGEPVTCLATRRDRICRLARHADIRRVLQPASD